MSKAIRPIVAGLLVGCSAAVVVLGLDLVFSRVSGGTAVNPLQTLEMQTYDWRLTRTARPETARKDIVLVEIDEYSLRNMEKFAGRWPWPRLVHGDLLDYLARGKPTVITYDVNFASPDAALQFVFAGETKTGAESDEALAKSARNAGNVIMLADATYEVDEAAYAALQEKSPFPPDDGYSLDLPGVIARQQIFAPYDGLRDAVSGFGHNLFILDPDGKMRHMSPFVRSNHRVLPSLGVASALKAAGIKPGDIRFEGDVLRFGDRAVMPLSERRVVSQQGVSAYQWEALNFRGPAFLQDGVTRPYTSYHFWDLWRSEQLIRNDVKPDIDPSVFRDKIVFVGVNATSLFDAFETPFSGTTGFRMPGVQIHAAIADDILSNRFIRPAPAGVRLGTVLVTALLVGLLATFMPAWWATAVTVVVITLAGGAAFWLFGRGYWLNLSQPVLASTLALFGGVAYQYFVEGREKRKMKKLFGQYVSKDVYDHLVANPDLARLGGARRDMTVLFSDIRGFTTVSERGQPEEIVHTLNEYFTRMVQLVFQNGGTLDKFVGDMVMALFGAPLDDPDHADHAVETALEMIVELRKLNEGWKAEGRPALDIGIGINTGPMIAGNIGSDLVMSYTVIGDAVNLGSRLESLNKQYGTRIIISEFTKAQLKKKYALKPLGDVIVKGKTKPVSIFELIGRDGEQPVGTPLAADDQRNSEVTTVTNATKEAHA
jgi:adenylate cyclase